MWWMTEVSKSTHCHCQQPVFRKHLPDPSSIIICMWKFIIMFIQPFVKCLHVLRYKTVTRRARFLISLGVGCLQLKAAGLHLPFPLSFQAELNGQMNYTTSSLLFPLIQCRTLLLEKNEQELRWS